MPLSHAIGGKVCNKVVAVFADTATASAAATSLRTALHLGHGQVRVIRPRFPLPGRRLDSGMADVRPGTRSRVKRAALRPQFAMALAGALAGAAVFMLLRATGVTLIVTSVLVALVALVLYGALSGLLIGRLLGLRADRGSHASAVLDELRKGHAAVVVHAHSSNERDRADAMLASRGGRMMAMP